MSDIMNREYSAEFDKLRKSRVEVSFYKYGPARDNFGRNLALSASALLANQIIVSIINDILWCILQTSLDYK